MLRFCFFSLVILVLSVFINSCGGQVFRNCSGSYADAYNKVHNFVFIYSRAPSDPQEFEGIRKEAASACQELETNYGDEQCMALKQGLSRKVSFEDFKNDCGSIQQGLRIEKKY